MSDNEQKYKNILGKYGILGGRPVAFKSPKAMRLKMLEFLDKCDRRIKEVVAKDGSVNMVGAPAPTTIEDFCAFAGITKTTFYDYGRKKEFKELIEGFKQIVEAYWVRQCAEGNKGNKADFILKNAFGDWWKDNKDVDVTLGGELKVMPSVKIDGTPLDIKVGENVTVDKIEINIGEEVEEAEETE